ncbi:vacuolar sorting protein 18-like [Rhododendron vialii]|uniref:vacuolar sorting protein 18-like n=1 Tax=Rhododendron vialii TaxID=182163 RepID=UPI00265EC8F1|nr:vacuolar sorting protein 18-like [Rhododendron vialii]
MKQQYEIVVHHYIQDLMQIPHLYPCHVASTRVLCPKGGIRVSQPIDLQYKFAPDLIMLDAYETVESWMTTKSLNPRKLIPAMMRYSSKPHARNETREVIKYLEFCIHCLQNLDPGVHNLLLSLYAKQFEANYIEEFEANYRGFDSEKNDLIELYNKLFCSMLCSDPKLDSHRFKNILDKAITSD